MNIFWDLKFSLWWGNKDSNLGRHKSADLQSAPVGRFGTPPLEIKILFSRIQRTTLKLASNNDFIALFIFKRVQNYSVFYLIQSFLVK